MSCSGMLYLFWCANEHLDFRIPEFEALAILFKIPLKWVEKNVREPWVILEFSSEMDAVSIASRSVSTKYCIQLWADGDSYEKFHANLKSFPAHLMLPFFKSELTFKVYVEAFMNKLTAKEKVL